MENPTYPLPKGYHLEEVDYDEWMPYTEKTMHLPFPDSVALDEEPLMTPEQKARKKVHAAPFAGVFKLFYLIKKGNEIVGWHSSRQTAPDRLYMELTGIFPGHKRQGLYTALIPIVLERAKKEGFELVVSRHHASNNAVLIPKMKAGFMIQSFEVYWRYGLMVHLHYHLIEHRKKVYQFRTGEHLLPDHLQAYLPLTKPSEPDA